MKSLTNSPLTLIKSTLTATLVALIAFGFTIMPFGLGLTTAPIAQASSHSVERIDGSGDSDGANFSDLQSALDDSGTDNADTLRLISDITTNQQVTIDRPITIDGNGYTISPTFAETSNSNNSAIGIIDTTNVTISNLTIDGAGGTSLHGINIFTSTGIDLNDVTSNDNENSGIVVNGSEVTVEDVSTSGNGWHAINVDLGSGVTDPATLTVDGTSSHGETYPPTPHIYLDDISKDITINDSNDQYDSEEFTNPNDSSATARAYYLSDDPDEGATNSDYECEGWNCINEDGDSDSDQFEKDFETTSRFGGTGWNNAIKDSQTGDITNDNNSWTDEETREFELTYSPSDGKITYTVEGTSLNHTYDAQKAFGAIALVAKGGEYGSAHIEDIEINGDGYGDVFASSNYWGIHVPLSDAQQQTGFTLTGKATLDWPDQRKMNSGSDEIPGFQIFALETHDLEEDTPDFEMYQCEDGPLHLRTEGEGSKLYNVNIANGSTSHLQDYNLELDGVLAVRNGGQIYSITENNEVVKLNADGTTNAPKQITENGDPLGAKFVAMDFAPNGTLYAMTQNSDKLYKINKGSGSATEVQLGTAIDVQGGDLSVTPANELIYTKNDGTVYSIDLNAASPHPVVNKGQLSGAQSISSTFYDNGTHYALDRRGNSHSDDTYYKYQVTPAGLTGVSSSSSGDYWYGDASSCTSRSDEEPDEKVATLRICKAVVDHEGNIVSGDEASGTEFSIDIGTGTSTDDVATTTTFTTPISPTHDLLADNGDQQDVQCKTVEMPLGEYYYHTEDIQDSGNWETPKYHDQFSLFMDGGMSVGDYLPYSSQLYDNNPNNDDERNKNADGHVILNEKRPMRTIMVLNRMKEDGIPQYQCEAGPLHLNTDTGDNTSEVYNLNTASGATSLWQTYEMKFSAGLAIDSGGNIYAVSSSDNHLHELNADGTTDDIGPLGVNGQVVAMDFAPDGTLYAMTQDTDVLYTVDPSDGSTAVVYDYDKNELDVHGGDFVVTLANRLTYIHSNGTVYYINPANPSAVSSPGSLEQSNSVDEVGHITSMTWVSDDEEYIALDRNNTYYRFRIGQTVTVGSGTYGYGDASRCAPEPDEPQEPQVCEPETNLINNGDFENPTVTHDKKWNIFDSGSSPLTWFAKWLGSDTDHLGDQRPETPQVELHAGVNGWQADSGSQYVELDSDWKGPEDSTSGEQASTMIYQDVPTVPGKTYKIYYSFSPRPDTSSSNNEVELLVGGDSAEVQGPTQTSGQTQWSGYMHRFTATSTETRIAFADRGTNDAMGTFVDKVSMTCQPDENDNGDGTTDTDPIAKDDSANTQKDTPVNIDVLANDQDADGDTLTIIELSNPSDGSAATTTGNKIKYTPDSGFTGTDTFTYTIEDEDNATSSATVTVKVKKPSNNNNRGGSSGNSPGQFFMSTNGSGGNSDSGGQVLGVQTSSNGQCGRYLEDYLRRGWENDSIEVMKLQAFLNVSEGTDIAVNGVFNQETENAVRRFQREHEGEILAPWRSAGFGNNLDSTGFVYLLTRWKINDMVCSTLGDEKPLNLYLYQG